MHTATDLGDGGDCVILILIFMWYHDYDYNVDELLPLDDGRAPPHS
jgi:hypothetical protein